MGWVTCWGHPHNAVVALAGAHLPGQWEAGLGRIASWELRWLITVRQFQGGQMVFCRGCGKEIHETAVSCPHCGAVQQVTVKSPKNQSGTLWLPVPSLILGVIVVLALFDESSWDKDTYMGIFTCIVAAIVLGGFGISTQERGRGMSIAGIVLGVIGLLGVIGRAVS